MRTNRWTFSGDKPKSETYEGKVVEFIRQNQRVYARVPSISSQFLVYGRTKRVAFAEAKVSIDHLLGKR